MNGEGQKSKKELKRVIFGDAELHKTDKGWEGVKKEGELEWKLLIRVSKGDERLQMTRSDPDGKPHNIRMHTRKIEDWLSGRILEAHIEGCDCKDVLDNFAMAVGDIRKNNWRDLPDMLPRFPALGSATTLK